MEQDARTRIFSNQSTEREALVYPQFPLRDRTSRRRGPLPVTGAMDVLARADVFGHWRSVEGSQRDFTLVVDWYEMQDVRRGANPTLFDVGMTDLRPDRRDVQLMRIASTVERHLGVCGLTIVLEEQNGASFQNQQNARIR